MTFAGETQDETLKDDDLVCTHQVCSKLNLGSLFHRDNRDVLNEEEYEADPFTMEREFSCPNCRHYLLSFLLKVENQMDSQDPESPVHRL